MPPFNLDTTFLGQPCGLGTTRGVNPEMHDRLRAADETVRAAFDALPAQERGELSYSEWALAYGPHACWRANAGKHSAGAAIDINPALNLYIVTRNGDVPGGEPGGESFVEMRKRALAAYDRAVRFHAPELERADVAPRRSGESTEAVWDRFKLVSDALEHYLGYAIDPEIDVVTRTALENADAVSDDELLAAIPEGERRPQDAAIAQLEEVFALPEFRRAHPAWQTSPRDLYVRIVRDYELTRIPLVIDAPSATPERTRNPARGFLHLRREIPAALCAQGLRWGACDLEIREDGSSNNGAMMHFDLADAGGFPEIHSLLRFG